MPYRFLHRSQPPNKYWPVPNYNTNTCRDLAAYKKKLLDDEAAHQLINKSFDGQDEKSGGSDSTIEPPCEESVKLTVCAPSGTPGSSHAPRLSLQMDDRTLHPGGSHMPRLSLQTDDRTLYPSGSHTPRLSLQTDVRTTYPSAEYLSSHVDLNEEVPVLQGRRPSSNKKIVFAGSRKLSLETFQDSRSRNRDTVRKYSFQPMLPSWCSWLLHVLSKYY